MDSPHAPGSRPAFPEEAVTWLAGPDPRSVVVLNRADVAAAFAAAGHDVTELPTIESTQAIPDRTVDMVVAAQGLPERLDDVARLLRPGGQLALVWNERDHRIPWARKLDLALEAESGGTEPESPVVTSGRFGFVSDREFRYWQAVNHESLAALLAEELADVDPEVAEARTTAALALYADYGRGADGMQLPWVSRCFKATVVESAWASPRTLDQHAADSAGSPGSSDGEDPDGSGPTGEARAAEVEPPTDQDGADLLLIDFR